MNERKVGEFIGLAAIISFMALMFGLQIVIILNGLIGL